jgi:hypothetical protein
MGWWIRLFSKKWLILGCLFALFPLFQNMSPNEGEDIRKIAPRRPAGDWDQPMATLFPKDFNGNSLGDVQKSFLSHNFDPMLKDLEMSYLQGQNHRFEFASDDPKESVPKLEEGGRWKLGLVNPTKLRFSYENQVGGQNFQLICEAQTGQDGMSVRMSRPLTSKLNLGLSHETSHQQSQVQMDYRW